MESTKPYLIRAIHQWCVDQGFTPYLSIAVDATTRVPQEFVRDGTIVLNVGLDATHQLDMGNDAISFQARFGGKAFPVLVPVGRVLAIYARENGQGMAFDATDADNVPAPADRQSPAKSASGGARGKGLHIAASPNTDKVGLSPNAADNARTISSDSSDTDKSSEARPHLTRIK